MRICGKSSCNCCQFQHYSTLTTYNIENCFEIKSTFKAIFFLNSHRHTKHTTLQTSHFQPIKTKNQVILKKKLKLSTGNSVKDLFQLEIKILQNFFLYQNTGWFLTGTHLNLLIIFSKISHYKSYYNSPLRGCLKSFLLVRRTGSFGGGGSFNTLIFFPYW